MTVKHLKDTYTKFMNKKDFIIPDGYIIVVTDIPWYKSWFGLKKTRIKISDGIRTFKQLNFV